MEEEFKPPTRYIYPYNPHTKTLADLPNIDYNPMIGPRPAIRAPIRTYHLVYNHPIVPRWDEVSDEIKKKIKELGLEYCAIECFQRRQLPEKSQAHDDSTVVISLQETPPITDEIIEVAREIHELSGNLFVEITESKVVRGSAQVPEVSQTEGVTQAAKLVKVEIERELFYDISHRSLALDKKPPYARQPEVGGSIGVSGNDWSAGTFGGYIELFKEGSPVVHCGLTCHHVLRPSKPSVTPPAEDFVPLAPKADENRGLIRICHPSLVDCQQTLSEYTEKLKNLSESRKLLEEDTDRNARELQDIREAIVKTEREKELFISSDREIGTVFATSGYGVFTKRDCLADWGLIEMNPECVGANIHNRKDMLYPSFTSWPSGFPLFEDEYPKLVRQVGRKSMGVGSVNPVKSCICFREGSQKIETKEFAIVTKFTHQKFSKYGDSGALVMNIMGEVVGLLWGLRLEAETCHEGGEASYFTPIEPIIENIQEVTGYQVRFGEIRETDR